MTTRRTLAMLYVLHSWAGILVGLWVFVVGVTGALLVFKAEIDLWANPSLVDLPRAASPVGPDAVLRSLALERPDVVPTLLQPPNEVNPSWFVFSGGSGGSERIKWSARADTGEIVSPVDSELGQFIRNVHVFLLFGPRWPVGFLGVVVLFLIASGLVIHRKISSSLFTLHWGRSFRVVIADVHRVAGVWGVGFHVVIAFTGAWLGLAPVFEQTYRLLADSGERPRVEAPATSAALAAVAVPPALAPSVDRFLARAVEDIPGLRVELIALTRWGRDEPRLRFSGRIEGALSSALEVTYDMRSGALLERSAPADGSALMALDRAMEPLHFGNFGSLGLKWLYFVLGLGQAALAASGTLIWLERSKLRLRDVAAGSAPAQGASQGHV